MAILNDLAKVAQRIFEGAHFFQARKIEVIGTFLDMRIVGSDRTDIKLTISGQIHRRSILSSADIYYKIMSSIESGKLTIKNKCSLAISPIDHCKITLELPRNMPITIFSEGLAHIEISDMEAEVILDISQTFVNFYRSKQLEARIGKQSKVMISSTKSEKAKLDISDTSEVDILNTAEIGKLDAVLSNKSTMDSLGKIGEASVFITGGGKLNIERILKSPTIITDEKFRNEIRIFKVGAD